ncbi:MAG: hypothetical protein HQL68_03705 [Magnetococcales bacterium]|nr:hypothetical protein [Magnetococcales bacterium]
MKLSDNTIPIVLLELVAGVIFLLVVLVSIWLVENRVITLSASPPAVMLPSFIPSTSGGGDREKAITSALVALEKRVGNLLLEQKKISLPMPDIKHEQLVKLIDDRLAQINPRLADLDGKMDSLLLSRDDVLEGKIKELDDKIESLIKDRNKYTTPLLGELNRKAGALFLDHDIYISPILKVLNEKVDLLLLEREKSLGMITDDTGNKPINPVRIVSEELNLPKKETVPPQIDLPKSVIEPNNENILLSIQEILTRYDIKSIINQAKNGLTLSNEFDFELGSSSLSDKQSERLARIADALTEILPCYTNSSDSLVMERCQGRRSPVGLDVILIKGFSVGDNVGTERFKYNWKLANTRAIQALKALVTSRPDLMEFSNRAGDSLFKSMAQMTKTGAKRSRRIELQFVFADQDGG